MVNGTLISAVWPGLLLIQFYQVTLLFLLVASLYIVLSITLSNGMYKTRAAQLSGSLFIMENGGECYLSLDI